MPPIRLCRPSGTDFSTKNERSSETKQSLRTCIEKTTLVDLKEDTIAPRIIDDLTIETVLKSTDSSVEPVIHDVINRIVSAIPITLARLLLLWLPRTTLGQLSRNAD